MNRERLSDVITKFQDAFRSAATSSSGFKLWEHVKQAHSQFLETLSSIEGGEVKEFFLDKARQSRASQTSGRRSVSKPSLSGKEVAKKWFTEGGPVSAQDYARVQGGLKGGDSPPGDESPEGSETELEMLLQPDSRHTPHEQSVVEVKGIYAGQVMVEAKCIDLDERQSAAAQQTHPENELLQSLIDFALYEQLLHERDTLTLGLQYPSIRSSLGQSSRAAKIKRGLPGFVNGSQTSTLADIEATQNIVSAASIQERELSIKEKQGFFRLKNSKIAQPIETVHTSIRSSFGQSSRAAKIKRGLPGFVNGSRTSALADTGAAQNIVSAAFVQERGFSIKEKQGVFRLGNSKIAQSIGTVNLRWAFSEKPNEVIDIICHVLPQCAYDLILGSRFLTATETFSKHGRRLANCVFSVFNVFHLNYLDGSRQTLDGKVGGYQVLAIPDTGAERNVMDLGYAETRGFKISARQEDRGFLQFADGTFQETVGQVNTTWTFASGLKIPVTFEVLENCSADVILGEDVLWEHNVFDTYAASMQEMPYENEEDELFDLAPFSYKPKWPQEAIRLKQKVLSMFNKRTHQQDSVEDETLEQHEAKEWHRRDQWNHQYGFGGANASPAEQEAEARRKRSYDARIEAFRRRPPRPGTTTPALPPPSTLTAPNNTPLAHPTAASSEARRSPPPLIPSIPTAPNDAHVRLATTDTARTPRAIPSATAVVPPDDAASDPAVNDQIRRGLRFDNSSARDSHARLWSPY
ncbi:MAG: hypothetical protein Q9161_005314 [Pseudevernia consocians]